MPFPRALLVLLPFVLWPALACEPVRACEPRVDFVQRADGGTWPCIKAEDCPRPSGVFVCVTDGDQDKDCVSCVDTECVRFVRRVCE